MARTKTRASRSACLHCGRIDRLGFADETRRQGRYVIAVVIICRCQVEIVSKVMRGLVRPGMKRSHFSKQCDCDCRLIISQLVRENIRGALLAMGRESSLAYSHKDPADEPMLWVADAIVWCAGAGGAWRARIGPILYR